MLDFISDLSLEKKKLVLFPKTQCFLFILKADNQSIKGCPLEPQSHSYTLYGLDSYGEGYDEKEVAVIHEPHEKLIWQREKSEQ